MEKVALFAFNGELMCFIHVLLNAIDMKEKGYDVYDDEAGVDVRGRFIIDPDGVIQAMEMMTPPVGRNVAELIRQVQAFQHVRDSEGTEAMPSGWTPGKTTLKPGPDLVGKVWKVWKTEEAF